MGNNWKQGLKHIHRWSAHVEDFCVFVWCWLLKFTFTFTKKIHITVSVLFCGSPVVLVREMGEASYSSRPACLYRWLWARLKCRGSLFTLLGGATAEQVPTMGPCSPLSGWGEEWRPLDMATWSLNAPTSPRWQGQSRGERKREPRGSRR